MTDPQLWFKSLHIMAVIAWMAGLFYLPRLFVYHANSAEGGEASEKFKIMEKRLLKVIMTPSMILTWVFGFLASWEISAFFEVWFYAKLLLVVLLSVFHFNLAKFQKQFELDQNTRSSGYFRMINEIPTILMVGIVIFAVFKPF